LSLTFTPVFLRGAAGFFGGAFYLRLSPYSSVPDITFARMPCRLGNICMSQIVALVSYLKSFISRQLRVPGRIIRYRFISI
jgi:hypothetical protein